jgi:hypothetical protein
MLRGNHMEELQIQCNVWVVPAESIARTVCDLLYTFMLYKEVNLDWPRDLAFSI